jgi:hypothetical protein
MLTSKLPLIFTRATVYKFQAMVVTDKFTNRTRDMYGVRNFISISGFINPPYNGSIVFHASRNRFLLI